MALLLLQRPARRRARGAKLPDATGATTINKVCGSGMKATMLAHDIINAGAIGRGFRDSDLRPITFMAASSSF